MRTIEQMVQQEVSCCLSSLIFTLANGDAHPGTDLSLLCDQALELISPVPDWEVYEHWAVSPWLASKLAAQGEKVNMDFANLNVWARTTTGQQISGDSVIQR